jgi:hypothetical protein
MSPRTLPILVALAPLLVLPLRSAPARADVRSDYLAALAALDDVAVAVGDQSSAAALERARQIVENLTPEELASIQDSGPDLSRLASAAEKLRSALAEGASAAGPTPAPLSLGFPSAPYSALCGSDRPEPGVLYGALLVFQAAESAREGASRGCDETVVVAGEGGNASLLCLALDIAWAAAKGAYEGIKFCDEDVDSAEIEGSYDRLGHLHDDLSQHDTDIKARIAQHDADIKARLDALDGKLDELRALTLRLAREEAMISGGAKDNIGLFESDGPDGIDATRDLVLETIETMEASLGTTLSGPRRDLAKGDSARDAGNLTKAYKFYRQAYAGAVR